MEGVSQFRTEALKLCRPSSWRLETIRLLAHRRVSFTSLSNLAGSYNVS
jgi:hypothetical protein